MIPQPVEPRLIESNFESEDIDFQLDSSSPVLFNILRKSMYSDPIRAIVCEISSNSRDANFEANRSDVPIKVFLPGEYIAFSDCGIGISPDRMRNIFCKYGCSSKTNTNLQRGMFGLGAKSPYAYQSEFTVETVHAGIKYTYLLYLDETDKGKIKLMTEIPTVHESGTTVKIPVRAEDRWRFKELAIKYTQFWKVRPLFPGHPTPEYNAPTLEGKHWAIYTRQTDGFNILVDEVPYHDNRHNIPPKVVLKFATGEVALSSNRENLFANDFTDNAIKNALVEYDTEVVQLVETKLDTLTSFAEVLNVIQTLPKTHVQRNWTWKGTQFSYPLVTPVTVYERPRTKLSSYSTKIIDDNVTDNSWILLDKDDLNTYDRQRIGSHLKVHSLKRIYLLDKDHTLPVQGTALSTIKVVRGPKTPRAPRAPKTTIKGRRYNGRRLDNYLIDTPTPIVYTLDNVADIYWIYNFPTSIIQISEKDVKHIEDEDNWLTMDEYISQNLYDKLTPTEIQVEADRQDFVKKYNNFSFLVDDDDFKSFKNTARDPKVNDVAEKIISWLVANGKITTVTKDIFDKYPLLSSLNYVNYDKHKHVIDYVKLVKFHQNSQTQTIKKDQAINV